MTFFLGTHQVDWLWRTEVPLFLSRIRLSQRKVLRPAVGTWALDSGGFTELNATGAWSLDAQTYAGQVRHWRDRIGGMAWAAVQDWMCEPFVLAKTGKTIPEHQALTVRSYLDLRAAAPEVPWVPVLQGWQVEDYLDHADQYRRAGVDLQALPLVGLGSVCRRQATAEAEELIFQLTAQGLRLHGFGFKKTGLSRVHDLLASADSLAWSYNARHNPPLPGCTHRSCANCLRRALWWREGLLAGLGDLGLFHGMAFVG